MTTNLQQFRTMDEARSIIQHKAASMGKITNIDFVLCEDGRAVMTYCDVEQVLDAAARRSISWSAT